MARQQPAIGLSLEEAGKLRQDMQFLRNTMQQASREKHALQVKVQRAQFILTGWRIQCMELPEGDPVRMAFENFIKTMTETLQ